MEGLVGSFLSCNLSSLLTQLCKNEQTLPAQSLLSAASNVLPHFYPIGQYLTERKSRIITHLQQSLSTQLTALQLETMENRLQYWSQLFPRNLWKSFTQTISFPPTWCLLGIELPITLSNLQLLEVTEQIFYYTLAVHITNGVSSLTVDNCDTTARLLSIIVQVYSQYRWPLGNKPIISICL